MRRLDLATVLLPVLYLSLSNDCDAQAPDTKFLTKSEILSDLALMDQVLHDTHPGLYLYLDSSDFQSQKAAVADKLSEQTSLPEVFGHFAGLVDMIQDGHTNLLLSEKDIDWILSNERFFPFTFRFLNDKVYINHNFSEHEYLGRGTEVTAINGEPIQQIIEKLRIYITCDGTQRSSELEALEGQFWWYYAMKYGFPSTFKIGYADGDEEKLILVSPLNYSDRYHMLSEVYGFEWTPEKVLDFKIDGDRAIITITQFYGVSKWKYGRFLKNAFSQIKRQNIQHLVIDIRKNGGGREGYENMLLSYLQNNLDHKYEEVFVNAPTSEYYPHLISGGARKIQDRFLRAFEFEQEGDHWVRKERFASTLNPQKDQFKGKVYLLIGGQVFSGGAEFASMARAYVDDCVLLGTETSGGAKQNTSGYYYKLLLPNTGLVLEIPRVYFRLAVPVEEENHGVLPDITVETTFDDFIKGTDTQLQWALDMIEEEFLRNSAMKE